jgi:peptide subunit release factor 1 (eRF1)
MVDILHREINTNGLAVVGTEECLKAFKHKQVDALVLASAYDPEAAWKCKACSSIHLNPIEPDACSECGEREFREISVKEEMVKMAEKYRCKVETVKHSDILMSFGGVGCLLRYLRPEQY